MGKQKYDEDELVSLLIKMYTEQVEHMGMVRFRTIKEIIKDLGMTEAVFYKKVRDEPDFKAAYELAKIARVDVVVDEILVIADETTTESQNIGINSARLRIDARKWLAEKHGSNYTQKVSINENVTNLTQEEIEARIAMLRKKTAFIDANPLN